MGTILIDKLLSACVKQGASDLHITVGQPPVLRLSGRMTKLKTKVLEPADTQALMKSITPDRCQQEFQETGSCDFGFSFGDACRFRVSVFRQRGSVAMVLRQIPVKMWSMEELGVPLVFKSLIARPRGLVIVTGPTGSGKTTSLAAMIDHLNDNYDHHIITIEDPIEFQHTHKKSTINQREVGVDVTSFKEALRRALRQDPDCILVGEMRDLETIEAAITAAETGHIVFGTLHTSSAAGTINRIIDVFPDQPAGADSHAVGVGDHWHFVPAAAQEDRRRSRGGLRNARGDAGHREPDSREQDFPHHVVDSNGCAPRHDAARRSYLRHLAARPRDQGRRARKVQ